ncbi:MAG: DNA gyrase inhibitor YacG [Nitrospiraceae bacterium]
MRCPTCRAETTWQDNPTRPFCSERCKLIDLGRWASERYRIPGESLAVASLDERPGDDPETDSPRRSS